MLILHTYRDGEEFGIFPQDISYAEVHGPVTAIVHLIRVQVPAGVIRTPQGSMPVPPHIESIMRVTEVSESIDEIQRMILALKQAERRNEHFAAIHSGEALTALPLVIPARREAAKAMKEAAFGGEKREEVKFGNTEEKYQE